MRLNKVLKRFALISGFDQATVSRYLPLIVECFEAFAEQLAGSYSDGENARLDHACAVYAYYRVSLCAADNFDSLRAGDVTVARSADKLRSAAQAMWQSEKALVSDLVDIDPDPVLKAVRI